MSGFLLDTNVLSEFARQTITPTSELSSGWKPPIQIHSTPAS
jgi:hypothetical protein